MWAKVAIHANTQWNWSDGHTTPIHTTIARELLKTWISGIAKPMVCETYALQLSGLHDNDGNHEKFKTTKTMKTTQTATNKMVKYWISVIPETTGMTKTTTIRGLRVQTMGSSNHGFRTPESCRISHATPCKAHSPEHALAFRMVFDIFYLPSLGSR